MQMNIFYYGGGARTATNIPFYSYDINATAMNLYDMQGAAARNAILGLMWVSLFLTLKVPGAILLAIVMTTFCGMQTDEAIPHVTDLSNWKQPGGPKDFLPDTPTYNRYAGHFDFSAASTPRFWQAVWTFLFVELFDSLGTISACMSRAGMLTEGAIDAGKDVNNAMLVDGFGLTIGSVIGSNSITCVSTSDASTPAGFLSVGA